MQPSLSHLENIDARFLEPDASLVVMCESTVADLDDVRLVLNGLSAIFDCAAGMNAGLCQAGATARPIDLPPDAMAAYAKQAGHQLIDEVDVILVDAEMPEMDGYVLTRKIKADSRFNGIPVVMHSSLSSDANRAMGKQVGVDAYVAKFDADVLADTLRPLLMRNHQGQDVAVR